jgi:hypothetical protein
MLEKQLKDAKFDRDILKKALAIFSKAPKCNSVSSGTTARSFR